MKKRLTALVLCVVMVLATLPFASAQGGEIGKITINGVPTPTDGAAIPYDSNTLIAAEPQLYKAYYWNMSWRVSDGIVNADFSPTFDAGELYTLTLLIVPQNGATGLDASTAGKLPVFIAGQKATYDPDCKPSLPEAPEKETFAYQIDLQCAWSKEIKVIDVDGLTLPASGAAPCEAEALSVPDGAPYSIAEAKWFKYPGAPEDEGDVPMENGEAFEDGKWYYLQVILAPADGYSFAKKDDCIWRFNGRSDLVDEENSRNVSSGFSLYSADFKAEARQIDAIDLNGVAETLFAGDPARTAFENVTIPAGAGYTLVTDQADVNVSKVSNNTYLKDGDLFEAGESYEITLRVTPKDGWTIDNTTVWRVNGKTDLVLGAKESPSGYWYCRLKEIPATEKTRIETVRIFGIEQPVAGWMAYECMDDVSVPNGPYHLVDCYWYNEKTSEHVIGDMPFEEGHSYSLCCVVAAYPGYAIDETTKFELNGGDLPVALAGKNSSGAYYVWTEPMEPLETCSVCWYLDVNDEYPVAGVDVVKGETFPAPDAPGKEGFTFGGWYTDKACTKPYDPTKPITEDTNLYPLWIKAVVTPSDCDGGEECPSYKFKDVKKDDWYHGAVDFAVTEGLFNGMTDTTFEPNTPMTRAMLVTVLWRYEGSPEAGASDFTDLKADWYKAAVAWAASKGIVTGVGNNRFDPDGKITREQLATILYRYSDFKHFDTSAKSDFAGFPDKNKISGWAVDAYSWAVGAGLITGNDGRLDPQGNATRAQVATILMRFIQNIVK